MAAINGYEELTKILLASGADVDVTDKFGQTPLQAATINGREKVVKVFLAEGVAVDTKDKYYGHTLLHLAVRNGYKDLAA